MRDGGAFPGRETNPRQLTGTPKADTIRAYGGEDVVRAFRAATRSSPARAEIASTGARATIISSSRDLDPGGIGQRDVVDCGPGYDTFAADFDERVLDSCEEGSMGSF